jgi:hypothetical protein
MHIREAGVARGCWIDGAQVRRKADPAKEALQTFVKRWKDDPKVQGHPSHEQVIGAPSSCSQLCVHH